MTERACENCAFPDEELVLVRRVYVTPETWDTPASQQVVNEPELWPAYVPTGVTQYLRLFSEWGGTKLERMREAGYEVEILDEGVEKEISGADVRAALRSGGDWEALVSPGVAQRYPQPEVAPGQTVAKRHRLAGIKLQRFGQFRQAAQPRTQVGLRQRQPPDLPFGVGPGAERLGQIVAGEAQGRLGTRSCLRPRSRACRL